MPVPESTDTPSEVLEKVNWLLKRAGKEIKNETIYYWENPAEARRDLLLLLERGGEKIKENVGYYWENPGDAPRDIWEWVKENPRTTACIVIGILIIAIPPAIGFGPAGVAAGSIAAGLQAGIGNVVAGSAFAIMQSLTMTGVLTGIGAGLIGAGVAGNWVGRVIPPLFRPPPSMPPENPE